MDQRPRMEIKQSDFGAEAHLAKADVNNHDQYNNPSEFTFLKDPKRYSQMLWT